MEQEDPGTGETGVGPDLTHFLCQAHLEAHSVTQGRWLSSLSLSHVQANMRRTKTLHGLLWGFREGKRVEHVTSGESRARSGFPSSTHSKSSSSSRLISDPVFLSTPSLSSKLPPILPISGSLPVSLLVWGSTSQFLTCLGVDSSCGLSVLSTDSRPHPHFPAAASPRPCAQPLKWIFVSPNFYRQFCIQAVETKSIHSSVIKHELYLLRTRHGHC